MIQLGYTYKISRWADMVTVHAISGPDVIKQLIEVKPTIGILIVAQLSCANNLIDSEYTRKAVEMAKLYPDNVVGFICQEKLDFTGQFMHLTPGVKLDTTSDGRGQQYRTPKKVIEAGCDAIIVGRGIYQAENPTEIAKIYKKETWNVD